VLRIENPRSRDRRFAVRCVRLCFAAFGGAPVAGRVLFCGLPGRADILGKGEVLTFTTTGGAGRQNVSNQNDRFLGGRDWEEWEDWESWEDWGRL